MPKSDYTTHKFMTHGSKWRRPKNRNKKAWRRINAGDIWWDDKAIAKKANSASEWHFYLDNLKWCVKCNKRILLTDDGISLVEHLDRNRLPCPGRNTVIKA